MSTLVLTATRLMSSLVSSFESYSFTYCDNFCSDIFFGHTHEDQLAVCLLFVLAHVQARTFDRFTTRITVQS
jgi:hypothetical protein